MQGDEFPEAQFLLARLDDFERAGMADGIEEAINDWHGHVAPAVARFRAVLAALRTAYPLIVPEGWQVVPKEPNLDMIDEGRQAVGCCLMDDQDVRDTWKDMLAAAPKPEDTRDDR